MYLSHHGILGQEWGKRNGPPYPLSGGDYTRSETEAILKAKKRKNSIYNKRHFDKVIEKGTVLSTLSYDKNRTKGTDMFYAAYDKTDKHQYNALFNKKIPQTIYDTKTGEPIGTGSFFKYRINNTAKTNLKVASEDSAAKIFMDLYSRNRDFYNFVTDPERMQKHFVDSKYKFKGYRESRDALETLRSGKTPSQEELQRIYRMFNYVIPSDGAGNQRMAKDVLTQRAKFFKEAKKSGYSALLDTNDSMYGGFKGNAPVIMFDMENISIEKIKRISAADHEISKLAFVGRKALGL